MSPIQIALLLLAVAGVWAVIELALTLRKTRTVVDSLDKTVSDLNNTLAEAQPVVAKLDGAVDELTPALAQVEPLLKSSKTAVDALTSNLVEVEAVVRDISEVTGTMAEASNAVSSVTDSAADVQRVFVRHHVAHRRALLFCQPGFLQESADEFDLPQLN